MKRSYERVLSTGKEYLDWLRKNPGEKPVATIVREGRIFLRDELTKEELEEVRIASKYNHSLVKTFVNDNSDNLIEGVPDEYKDEMKKIEAQKRNIYKIVKKKKKLIKRKIKKQKRKKSKNGFYNI